MQTFLCTINIHLLIKTTTLVRKNTSFPPFPLAFQNSHALIPPVDESIRSVVTTVALFKALSSCRKWTSKGLTAPEATRRKDESARLGRVAPRRE